jgi:hypothetical protein
MIRILLVLAVIALGTDAVLNNGAYTQAAWGELRSYTVKLTGSGPDPKVTIEKKN